MNEQLPISAGCILWIPHTATDFKGEMLLTHARRQGQIITMTIKAGDHQCKKKKNWLPGSWMFFYWWGKRQARYFDSSSYKNKTLVSVLYKSWQMKLLPFCAAHHSSTDRSILNGPGEMGSQGDSLCPRGHGVGGMMSLVREPCRKTWEVHG